MASKWLKLDVNFLAHHKVRSLRERLGSDAVLFHIAALQYAKCHGPDGYVDVRSLAYLAVPFDMADGDRLATARECEALGLWDRAGSDGWFIHNWSKYQSPSQTYREPGYPQAFGEIGSGSEVTTRETRESPLYVNTSRAYNNPSARPREAKQPRENPERPREIPRETPVAGPRSYGPPARPNVCPECEMPAGRHLLDCPRGTQQTEGATTFRTGAHIGNQGGPVSVCPSCAMPWASGHLSECNYDPRRPLDAKPVSGNDVAVMPKPVDFEAIRNRLRRGDSDS